MTIIEDRASWGARSTRGTSYLARTRGVKAHYTGDHVSVSTLTDHEACRAHVRNIQKFHMDGRGWNDIGYSMIVCNHNRAMIGRGDHVLPAANGPGLNSNHYAILVLVGETGVTSITRDMKIAFHGARRWLQSRGSAGAEIKGHRDGFATSCPGPSVYSWILGGSPLPGGKVPKPPPKPPVEDDTMDYGSFGFSGDPAFAIPADTWTNVPWDTEYSDPYGSHSGTASTVLLGDPSEYTLEFGATLTGLTAGTVVYVRTAEYRYNGSATPPVDELEEVGDPTPNVIGAENTVHHCAVGSVNDGRKLRVQILSPAATTVTRARVRYLAQR